MIYSFETFALSSLYKKQDPDTSRPIYSKNVLDVDCQTQGRLNSSLVRNLS
jgi:hypothetical protein